MYKWRHDRVLEVLSKWLRRALRIENEDSEEGGQGDDEEDHPQHFPIYRGRTRGRVWRSGDDEQIPMAKIFVAAIGCDSEPGLSKWPSPGRPLDVAGHIAYAFASRGKSATSLDSAG